MREQGETLEMTQRELRAQRPSPFTEAKRALPMQHSATPALGVLLPISAKARPRIDWGDRIKDQLDEWTVVHGRGSAPRQVWTESVGCRTSNRFAVLSEKECEDEFDTGDAASDSSSRFGLGNGKCTEGGSPVGCDKT